jgi:hypothetical protein
LRHQRLLMMISGALHGTGGRLRVRATVRTPTLKDLAEGALGHRPLACSARVGRPPLEQVRRLLGCVVIAGLGVAPIVDTDRVSPGR